MVQARIRVLRADIRNRRGLGNAETLTECEAAAAVLESGGDLDGLAEALTSVGKLRFWLGDALAGGEILERAVACARQSGNHRAQMRASHWLAVTFHVLPIPADTAIARTELLLQDASGDAWAEADLLKPLCVLYAYVGRSADARAAIDRSQSIFAGFGAKLALAESAIPAALVGLIIGDPVAAEHYARDGYQAFRAMGDCGGFVADLAVLLADALYAQGRFDEARQMIEEAYTEPSPGTIGAPWLTKAKLLARRGQFAEARRLVARQKRSCHRRLHHWIRLRWSRLKPRLSGSPGHPSSPRPACAPPCRSMRAAGQRFWPSGPEPLSPASPLSPAPSRRNRPACWFNTIPTRLQHPSLTLVSSTPATRPATRPERSPGPSPPDASAEGNQPCTSMTTS